MAGTDFRAAEKPSGCAACKKSEGASVSPRFMLRLFVLLAVLTCAAPVLAAPGDVDRIITAAREAQRAGDYDFAIQAFRQARRTFGEAPPPFVALALADAHQQRFATRRGAWDRLQAIVFYRRYLASQPTDDAQRARDNLAQLEGLDPRADVNPTTPATDTRATRVAIRSPLLSAEVRVDGGNAQPVPLRLTLEPGTHRLEMTAPGFEPLKRRFVVRAHRVDVIDLELTPKPALLSVATKDAAEIYIDEVFVGTAPLDEALKVEPGQRQVDVLLNGHHPFREHIVIPRGDAALMKAELDRTSQRVSAITLLSFGAVGIATAIATGAIATVTDRAANDVIDADEEKRLLKRGDDFAVVSGMAAGVGLGLTLFGGTLFVLDEPDVGLVPGPGQAGASVRVRF